RRELKESSSWAMERTLMTQRVRATMGALFSLKMVRCTLREFREWARITGVAVVGSSPRGLMCYRGSCCRWPAVLVIGSEREGMSKELLATWNLLVGNTM